MTTGAMVEAGSIISTGSSEIDKKLGGGIPIGSLVLLEGQSDAGKSVVSQHFTHGSLNSRMSAAYYTTENTVKSHLFRARTQLRESIGSKLDIKEGH